MERIQLTETTQRTFIDKIIRLTGATSLRGLQELGITTPYSTLKNYYTEQRLMPLELYQDLCTLAGLDWKAVPARLLLSSWGQTKGGRKSKRKKNENNKSMN